MWRPDSGLAIKTYTGHSQEVLDVDSSFDNSRLCSGGVDKRVLYIDVMSGKIVKKFQAHAGKLLDSRRIIFRTHYDKTKIITLGFSFQILTLRSQKRCFIILLSTELR